MRKAARVHGLHWGIAVLITCAIAGAIFHDISKERHDNLIARTETTVHLLANSRGRAVPLAIAELDELPEEMVLGELNDRWSKGDDGKSLPFAYALADMGKVDVAFLISQIATASPDEVDNLVRACDSNKVLAALESAAEETGIAAAETTTEREVEPHWRRKARLAIVALHLGNADLSTDMCGIEGRPDPSQRTLFISEFAKWHGSLGRLFESISPETISTSSPQSVALRSGLCLAIGSMVPDQIEKNAKDDWTNRCQKWFQEKPDKETHSAAGFVLRKWDKEPKIAGSRELPADRDWYVNTAGMTMLKIPSGKFQRWFPRDKQDRSLYTPRGRQEVELTRPYWLADREVTFGQYRQFTTDEDYDGEKPPAWPGPDAQTEHTDDHPVHNVSWYDAVLFCNWLSDKEELQPCYEPSGTTRFGTDDDAIVLAKQQVQSDNPHTHMGPGIYVIWNDNFKANGYRLPTEAEWEHACRAGTQTIYAFGNDLRMLSDYAYGTEKGGTKLPNGWGMFDMHRSPWEHCFDWRAPYGKDPVTDPVVRTFQGNSRVIRGGGGSPPYFTSHVREEKRKVSERIICQVDALREKWWGFRVARNHVP